VALKSQTPFPVFPYLIASRTYNVRGILIALVEIVAEMKLLEQDCMIFLDGLPTVNRSCVRHKNRVLCEERGHGGGIAVVKGLVILLTLRIELLDYLWIDRVFLLGEGWHSKADCQPY
jgi:hypothetical protein